MLICRGGGGTQSHVPGGVPVPCLGGGTPSQVRGYPIPGLGGYPVPGLGGYPVPCLGGTPSQGGGGYPIPGPGGYPIPGLGGTPSQSRGYPIPGLGGYPISGWGYLRYPPRWPDLGWGTPPTRPGMGYPPSPDLGWGTPLPSRPGWGTPPPKCWQRDTCENSTFPSYYVCGRNKEKADVVFNTIHWAGFFLSSHSSTHFASLSGWSLPGTKSSFLIILSSSALSSSIFKSIVCSKSVKMC